MLAIGALVGGVVIAKRDDRLRCLGPQGLSELFMLGPGSSPQDVEMVVKAGGTYPIECNLFQIGSLLYNWRFGAPPVQYCPSSSR